MDSLAKRLAAQLGFDEMGSEGNSPSGPKKFQVFIALILRRKGKSPL